MSLSNNGYQKVIDLAKEKDCEFVDLKFINLPGSWQHITLTLSGLNQKLFEEGFGFDGSSIRGFQQINDSDMLLIPDASTAFIDPVYENPTISLICDIVDPLTKEGYSRDPRLVARKAESYLKNSGIADASYWGPELEFFIFDGVTFDTNSHESYYHINSNEGSWNSGDDKGSNRGYFIRHKEGYFKIPPNDQTLNLRYQIVKALKQAGLKIDFHHHEVATAGQTEIGLHYGTLVNQADNTITTKYIAKNIAQQNGYTATFMPKPLYLDNGNAMHVHQSLWKGGTNLFYDDKGYAKLSQLAMYYIGGLLAHSPALLAFAAPSTNSYRRLVPGYEAPVALVYSQRNRSASIRIPVYSSHPDDKRIEYRCPDATSNAYLALAAMLMAGLDGISNQIDPGQPFDEDISRLESVDYLRIKKIPSSLGEVLDALEKDHLFLLKENVFTADLINTWIDYKRKNELEPVSLRPHPFEFCLYYDI
jgi:glutamine synthetase